MSNVYYTRPSLITINSDEWQSGSDFVLTDHGREPVQISVERIGYKARMANGRMRTKFIADKRTLNLSWENLPSRRVAVADGFSSATDLKDFHQAVQGSFTIRMYADDGYGGALVTDNEFASFNVFIEDFSYTIQKRGGAFDLWSVEMTLEEA